MLGKTIEIIAQLLGDHQIPYMIIGGYAVLIHGEQRVTQDVDVTLGLDIDAIDRILAILDPDFRPVMDNPREFAAKTNVLLLENLRTGVRVDLIFSFAQYEHEAISRAEQITIGDTAVTVISAEDLIVYKMLSGRPRDLEDVEGVLIRKGSQMNLHRVGNDLTALAALMESSALAQWEQLYEKWRQTDH